MFPSKVAFVLPDLGGGGAQRTMLTLARGLDQARFSLHFIVVGVADEFADEAPSTATIEQFKALRLRRALPGVIRSLSRLQPKIVVSTMGYINLALLAAQPLLGRDVALVVREANVVQATLGALPRWLPGRQLYAWLYPRAAAVIAPTNNIAEEIALVASRASERIVVMPNPVDEERLRARAGTPLRAPGDGLALVAAGRLTRQKGFDRLIALMPQLPGARLTIFGEGPDRVALERQVYALGIQDRVALPGFSSELPAAIAGADLLVLPSRWEGLPNVVLESLALGTPVVASEDAGVEEIARMSAGTVTIAPVDYSFVDAIKRRRPATAPIASPRQSLLPPTYRAEIVAARLNDLLHSVAHAS